MKHVILLLPTLCEAALIAAVAWPHTALPLTPSQRASEIRLLRAEQKAINARLDVLRAQGREFLPRGMGK